MRAVLDANVLISAAIARAPSHRIVQAWLRDETFELVICDRLLGEVRGVLTERLRLRKWISLESAEQYVRTLADVQPDPASGPALTRDPDDDYVIHLARAHHVDLVVSGDDDLLEWDDQEPPVIAPAEFEVRLNQLRVVTSGPRLGRGRPKPTGGDTNQTSGKPQVSERFLSETRGEGTRPHWHVISRSRVRIPPPAPNLGPPQGFPAIQHPFHSAITHMTSVLAPAMAMGVGAFRRRSDRTTPS